MRAVLLHLECWLLLFAHLSPPAQHQTLLQNYHDGSNVPKDKQDLTYKRARKNVEQWKTKAVFLRNYTTKAVHQVHEPVSFVYVDARVSPFGRQGSTVECALCLNVTIVCDERWDYDQQIACPSRRRLRARPKKISSLYLPCVWGCNSVFE